jgi:hypothetical protein
VARKNTTPPPADQDAILNLPPLDPEAERKKRQALRPLGWGKLTHPSQEPTGKTPSLLPSITAPEIQTRGPQMLEDGKSFIQDGVRYFPLSAAATAAQAPRSTLLEWIKKGTKFNGRPLQTYHFAPANRYFLSEESIIRAANRFIRWPSQQPAGPVTIGDTDDQHGYVGLTDAARSIGVDHRTVWLWATQGKAPTDEQPSVIKCPASDQYYIHERDVSRLKKLIPRAGLKRGRRPNASLHPD